MNLTPSTIHDSCAATVNVASAGARRAGWLVCFGLGAALLGGGSLGGGMPEAAPMASAPILEAPPLPRSVTVTLQPPEAVAAGARWRLAGETDWRESGVAYEDLTPGLHLFEFETVEGWITPDDDRPVWIPVEGFLHIWPFAYLPAPRFPIEVAATRGGFVVQENWVAGLFNGLRPSREMVAPDAQSRTWEMARRLQLRSEPMFQDRPGLRMSLHALADPGHRFVGWTGDATGTRNPLRFVVDRPRTIRAVFEPKMIGALQAAEGYRSPGRVQVHCQFNYPVGDRLESLTWQPVLPSGWTLAGVNGLGGPAVEGGTVRFLGPLGHNPIQFNLILQVPPGHAGARSLVGTVSYRLIGEAEPGLQRPPPLTLLDEPATAARVELDVSTGHPVLTLHGQVGRTYVVEQIPELFTSEPFKLMWVFMGDVTLTRSPQTFMDPTPVLAFPRTFYRATVLE